MTCQLGAYSACPYRGDKKNRTEWSVNRSKSLRILFERTRCGSNRVRYTWNVRFMDKTLNYVPGNTYRPTDNDGFDALREVFPGLVVTIQTGTYVDHGYIEHYEQPFDEVGIRTAQKLLLESTSWLVREISWTIRDNQIKTNAIFLIRRRPQ